jgi:hypothetical protein
MYLAAEVRCYVIRAHSAAGRSKYLSLVGLLVGWACVECEVVEGCRTSTQGFVLLQREGVTCAAPPTKTCVFIVDCWVWRALMCCADLRDSGCGARTMYAAGLSASNLTFQQRSQHMKYALLSVPCAHGILSHAAHMAAVHAALDCK